MRTSRVIRLGNSKAIVIPASLARLLGKGDVLEWREHGGWLLCRKIVDSYEDEGGE